MKCEGGKMERVGREVGYTKEKTPASRQESSSDKGEAITYFPGGKPSIIGGAGLNGPVRDGKG